MFLIEGTKCLEFLGLCFNYLIIILLKFIIISLSSFFTEKIPRLQVFKFVWEKIVQQMSESGNRCDVKHAAKVNSY